MYRRDLATEATQELVVVGSVKHFRTHGSSAEATRWHCACVHAILGGLTLLSQDAARPWICVCGVLHCCSSAWRHGAGGGLWSKSAQRLVGMGNRYRPMRQSTDEHMKYREERVLCGQSCQTRRRVNSRYKVGSWVDDKSLGADTTVLENDAIAFSDPRPLMLTTF